MLAMIIDQSYPVVSFFFFLLSVRRQVQTSTGEEERLIIIYRTDVSTRVETACETALSINYVADVSRKLS